MVVQLRKSTEPSEPGYVSYVTGWVDNADIAKRHAVYAQSRLPVFTFVRVLDCVIAGKLQYCVLLTRMEHVWD